MADYELQTRRASTDGMVVQQSSALAEEHEHEEYEVQEDEFSPADAARLDGRVVFKLDTILLPFLSLFFLVNSLDRSNVGNAETANFTQDTGLEPQDLNTAVACFFAVFVALQPVGAGLGRRIGMRIFVPSCMIIWGILTTIHIWITARWQLILVRILIGSLEAGFYPTTVSYMSLFYTRYEFARRLGVFYGQFAIAGAFGGILSYLVFSRFPPGAPADSQAWRPWQLLFLLEGSLTVILALIGFFWLPSSAESAWFFNAEERRFAEYRIARDRTQQQGQEQKQQEADADAGADADAQIPILQNGSIDNDHEAGHRRRDQDHEATEIEAEAEAQGLLPTRRPSSSSKRFHNTMKHSKLTNAQGLSTQDIIEAFTEWKVFYLLIMNILSAIPAAAFTVFLPLVVEGFGFDSVDANLFTAPPFLAGAIVVWIFTWWSDRRKQRMRLILYGLVILIVGLTAVVMLPHTGYHLRYIALCVLLGGSFVASPLTIAWFAGNIEEPGKRSVVLGINGWGNLAGVFSSVLFAPRFGPEYRVPFFITLALVITSFVGFMLFAQLVEQENHRRNKITKGWKPDAKALEMVSGVGPAETTLENVRQRLGIWLTGHRLPAGRRGEDRLTFRYGI